MSSKGAALVALIALAQQLQPVDAFFRLANQVLVTERADPIISPGGRSAHAHSIAGGSNFDLTIDFATMRKSNCTTAGVTADMSAYWSPLAYFWHKNGSFIAPDIGNQGQQVYYGYNVNENTKPFPEGLRIVAGNPFTRTQYSAPNARADVTCFDCLRYSKNLPNTKTATFPPTECPDGTRANVFFPSCGNGQTDSADHKSHMAYRLANGSCPVTHPNLYPELHYELYFSNFLRDVPWADAMNPAQPMVLSNGDPTGYSFHGDFFAAWDNAVLAKALKECDGGPTGDGRTDICKHFTTQTGAQMEACKLKGESPHVQGEKVKGWLPKLPGCNAVTKTEAEALAQFQAPCNDGLTSPGNPVVTSASSTQLAPSATTSKRSTTAAASTGTKPASTSTASSKPTTTGGTCAAAKTVTSTITKTATVTKVVTRNARQVLTRMH